jgi:hypothetical protein
MITDFEQLLSSAQSVTADAASTNLIDLGAADNDLGAGEPMALVVNFDVAMGGTTPSVIVKLQQDTASAFSSPTDVVSAKSVASAALGDKIILPIPPGAVTEQYLRAYYDVSGTNPTMTLTASIMPMSHIAHWDSKPDAL